MTTRLKKLEPEAIEMLVAIGELVASIALVTLFVALVDNRWGRCYFAFIGPSLYVCVAPGLVLVFVMASVAFHKLAGRLFRFSGIKMFVAYVASMSLLLLAAYTFVMLHPGCMIEY